MKNIMRKISRGFDKIDIALLAGLAIGAVVDSGGGWAGVFYIFATFSVARRYIAFADKRNTDD